ncbi:MAG: STAS/SEC14 domain-containing protein [Desulfomicrobium sp.]|nr:STAS/SEC14 domain-containing protein [Alphaproteobacteria bacterium]MBU4542364.1 STAS/SEC14 domain-containing protein [Alphaproteobacteria bacterium]MBU4551128.1 STAS/SEC14 domain-containing protein [Alphaproteobacteria bacterium]MBV1713119.1 STAS/SEC14 domain-containing protein [Desulfomicrobium sp.]
MSAEEMEAMAATINQAFDERPPVSMLLVFEYYDGLKTGAGLDVETFKSQFRSLAKVDKYAVVGAPSAAATLINVMDNVIPVDARTFDASDQQAA